MVSGVCALDERGKFHGLDAASLGFGYRQCALPDNWTFVSAALRGEPGERDEILARIDDIKAAREASQPVKTATGGSTFANPSGRKAWKLIEDAGCRGLARGGAMVSEKHCNFLVNTGTASAADIEGLGEEVRRRVYETSGVRLEWEIRRIGVTTATGPAEVNP